MPRFENTPEANRITNGSPPAAGLCDTVRWDDLRVYRRRWQGPLVVKGILHPEDAREAISSGADAIIVSNHGGRNLDSAIAAIDALPAIIEAVNGKAEVLVDSGVRSGSDIAKAISLGAKAVLVGRSALYGLAFAGLPGALHGINMFHSELLYTMAMLGCPRVTDLGRHILTPDTVPA